MTNLFKKTLVAAAVLSFAGAASAATIAVNNSAAIPLNASVEGAKFKKTLKLDTLDVGAAGAVTGTKAAGADLGLTFGTTAGANLAAGSKVAVKVSGGSFKLPAAGATDVPRLKSAVAGGNAGTATFTYDSALSSASELIFTVGVAGVAADVALVVQNAQIDVSGAANGGALTLTLAATNGATVVDTYPVSGSTAAATYNFKNQLISSANDLVKLDGVISTASGSRSFTSASNDDVLTVPVTINAGYEFGEAPVELTHTIKGDFSYLIIADDKDFGGNGNAALSSGEIATLVTLAGGGTAAYSVSTDMKTLTIKETGTLNTANRTVTFKSPMLVAGVDAAKQAKAPKLPVTTFSWSLTGKSNVNIAALNLDFAPATDYSAGQWRIDGSSTFVPYMPFGNGVSQIVYVTNNSAVDGTVTITGYDEAGKKYGPFTADVKAKSVKEVSSVLKAGVAAAGLTTGKLALEVTTSTSDVSVYAAYNVGGSDRGSVTTASTKN